MIMLLIGALAGAVNGLFGAGGGMLLVPLLIWLTDISESDIFPASISIMLPICLVSLCCNSLQQPLPWREALPYLLGGSTGGILAGFLGKQLPTLWLHRILGMLILWGGFRYLC